MRMRSRLWLSIITVTLLSVVLVLTDAIPLMRGPEEWRWTLRVLRMPLWRILVPIGFLALYMISVSRWLVLFPLEAGCATDPPHRTRRLDPFDDSGAFDSSGFSSRSLACAAV